MRGAFSVFPWRAIRLEHFRSNADVYDQHFCPGLCRLLRRPLAEPQRTAHRCLDRRRALRAGSFSRQFLHSLSWLYLTYGVIAESVSVLHTSFRSQCSEVVSQTAEDSLPELRLADSGRRAYYRARGYATDSERRCPEHFCLSRDRIPDGHGCNGLFMQNPPAGWKPEGWRPTATETLTARAMTSR